LSKEMKTIREIALKELQKWIPDTNQQIEFVEVVLAAYLAQMEPVAWKDPRDGLITENKDHADYWDIHGANCIPYFLAPPIPAGWKPIETAPKDGTRILAVVIGYRVCISYWFVDAGKWMTLDSEDFSDDEEWNKEITDTFYSPNYWMPLPEAPINAVKEK